MSDLVEGLKSLRIRFTSDDDWYTVTRAADYIEQLEADKAELLGVLEVARPFIGWGDAPDGLINEVDGILAKHKETDNANV